MKAALALFTMIGLAAGCSSSGGGSACDASCESDLQSAYTAGTQYTYTVTGDAVESPVITYTAADNNVEQATNAPLPWTLTVGGYANDYVLSAQNGADGSTITCSISNGTGEVVDTNTATGQYAIAQCQIPG